MSPFHDSPKGDKDDSPLLLTSQNNLTPGQWEALGVSDKVCDGYLELGGREGEEEGSHLG